MSAHLVLRRAVIGSTGALLLVAALLLAGMWLAGGREGQIDRWSAGRSLTAGELRELRSVFYGAVDYSHIRLARAPFPAALTACVIGSRITFQPGYYVDDFSSNYLKMALLVHEVGHVWANQRYGPYASIAEILEHVWYGDRVYVYRGLGPARALTDFRFEQQGHILSDYYERRYLGEDVSRYEETIYASLKRPPSRAPTPIQVQAARAGAFLPLSR